MQFMLSTIVSHQLLLQPPISETFRFVPIRPTDYHLMSFNWQGKYYYDKFFPLKCSSSCLTFQSIYNMLVWILQNKFLIMNVINILNVFLFVGSTCNECKKSLSTFVTTLSEKKGSWMALQDGQRFYLEPFAIWTRLRDLQTILSCEEP